jgi:hypothetical protein
MADGEPAGVYNATGVAGARTPGRLPRQDCRAGGEEVLSGDGRPYGTCDPISPWAQLAAMLLPRFSIRTALVIVTVVAVISLFAGQALGGRAWALGLTVAVVSVPIALVVHAAFYWVAMLFAHLLGPEDVIAYTSRGGVERSSFVAPRPVANSATAGSEPATP